MKTNELGYTYNEAMNTIAQNLQINYFKLYGHGSQTNDRRKPQQNANRINRGHVKVRNY